MSSSPSFEYPHTTSRENGTPPSTSPTMDTGRQDVPSDISNKKISEKIQFIEKKFGSSPPQVKPKPFQRPTRSPLSDSGKGPQSPVKNLSVSNSPTTSPKLHFSSEENDQEDLHGRGHISSPEKTPSHSSASSNSTPILPPRNYLNTLEKTSSSSFSSSSDTTPTIPPRNYSPSELALSDSKSEGVYSKQCNRSNSSPLASSYNGEKNNTLPVDRSDEDFIASRPPMPLPTERNPHPDIKLTPSVPNLESSPDISSLSPKKHVDLPSRVFPRQVAPGSPVFARETNRPVSPIVSNLQANLPDTNHNSQHLSVKGPQLPSNSPSVFRPITPVREAVNIPTSPSAGMHQNLQKISPQSPPQVPLKKPLTVPHHTSPEQRMASTFSHSLPKQAPSPNQAWSYPVHPGDPDRTQSQSQNINSPSSKSSTVGGSVVNAPPSVSFTVTSSGKQKSGSVRCRPLPELPIAQITTSGHLPGSRSHVYDYVFNWEWQIGEKGQSNLFPSVRQILQERKIQTQSHKVNWSPPLPLPQAEKHPLSPPVGNNNDSDDDYEKMNDNPSPAAVENLQMSVSIADNQYNHETCISVHQSRPLPRVRVGTDSSVTSTGYVKVDEPFKDPFHMIVGSDGYIPMKSQKSMIGIMQRQESTLTQSSLYYNVPASHLMAGMTSMDLETNQYYNVRRTRQVHNLEYLDVSVPPRPAKPAKLSLPPPRPPKPVIKVPPLPPKGIPLATDKRLEASDPFPLQGVRVQQPLSQRYMSNAFQQQMRYSPPSSTVTRSPSHPLISLPPRNIRRDGPYVWDPRLP